LEELDVKHNLTYKEQPVKILDTSKRATRSKVIRMFKVQWSQHWEDEATWEREDELKEEFPQLFSNLPESLDEIAFKGVGFVTP
jgi:kynurenine formamidase